MCYFLAYIIDCNIYIYIYIYFFFVMTKNAINQLVEINEDLLFAITIKFV